MKGGELRACKNETSRALTSFARFTRCAINAALQEQGMQKSSAPSHTAAGGGPWRRGAFLRDERSEEKRRINLPNVERLRVTGGGGSGRRR